MITVEGECLGLRFCGGERDREMDEEMELEEGEAYFYHNDNNVDDKFDDCIDPDVAFSYMDVKIRDVLGHFQKDFEGGVSAENLGAKFGGYGSFLPTYQRSLVQAQSRSSPTASPLEGPCHNGAVSVAASEILSHTRVKSSTAAISQRKQRSIDSSKQKKCMPPLRTIEDENSSKSANRKSSSGILDQKMLKVRIKLGSSDNLSTQNKAAIYSGLGLDASPSSLLDESPSESEGMFCGPIVMGFNSPTSIVQIMTSCPLNGEKLLSPLPDDLIHFAKKKRPLEQQKGDKLLDEKISKSMEKKDAPMESKGSNSKKSKRKELDVDSLACEDLILKTMELPIISGTGNGTSARVQSVPYRGQGDSSHSAGKISEDERGTHEPEANFLGHEEKKALNTEGPSSRGKKKPKGSQNEGIQLADPAKESLSGSSSVTKCRKSIGEDISRSVSENGEVKSRKVLGKGRDIYRDFFGEFEQEEENQAGTLGPDSGNGEDSGPVENNTNLKVRVSENIIAKVSASEMHFDAAPDVAPPASVAPFVIKENWVCCDKCEKWRLLPVGKDPNGLPKKWLCSMLDWLPGKNRCSVSEIETNAVISQSYALAPTSQNNIPLNSAMSASAFAATMVDPDENRLICTPEGPSVSGKKKHGMKQVIHPSVAGGPSDSEQGSKSKQRPYERLSDGGDANMRLSKKVRNRDIQSADEDQRSAGGSSSRKLGRNGNSNDRARILKADSTDEVPLKQQKESLKKRNSDIGKSVLKKRNHNRDSEVLTRDNDEHRKGKKARVSKNERKESTEKCGSDGTIKSTRKGEKDMQPLVGPTSSPYKASKSKGSFQEVKGSPAESVSSSPMRSSKPDMLASMVRNVLDSDEKEKNQSSKYEGEADQKKASHGEVKWWDSGRKKTEDERNGKNDSLGKTCGNDEKSSKRGSSTRADQIGDGTRIKKSKALPPSRASLTEAPYVSRKLNSEPTKVNKASRSSETVIAVNRTRHPGDRRDSTQAANNAMKEAKDLKHMADRVKASGSNLEGIGLYFQAALKFLHGASLLESSINAGSKNSETQSVQIYSSTAKLCEFCAHEYEKSKDMASAVLAYKCMEVACMKVVFLSQSTTIKDRQELQTALKLIPPGESPSSSVSDVDHINNTAAVDSKAALSRDDNTPHITGNRIITAQNRSNFERLLNFSQHVNNAMEASRKSMAAFNAASLKSADSQYKEVIASIKRAIDFNFQDVEGLLQLVRVSTEAISR